MHGTGRARVSLVRCQSYEPPLLRGALEAALRPLGGIAAFVRPGQRVLLKPNLLSARDPSRAVTTHPLLVEAAAHLVREAGGVPLVGDSPGGAIRGIQRVWDNTQMSGMARRAGLELVNFEASGSKAIDAGGYRFYIARPVLEADLVINLPKLKTHSLTLLTGAVKNVFGVIPGFRKSEMHKLFPKPAPFAAMLVELYRLVRPALSIVDAVVAMEGNGPGSGEPRGVGLVAAGSDAVALDAVLGRVIGYRPGQVDTTRIADARGVGTGDLSRIDVEGDGAAASAEGFRLPSNLAVRLVPGALARLVAPLVWLRLEIDTGRCTGCGLCHASCPVQAIVPEGERYRVRHELCVQCMCCHELCPEKAIAIRLSRLARLWA